jgi:Ca2+-binding EF-hand superfamily protein
MMLKMFDRDDDYGVDVSEFCSLWQYLSRWRQTFDRYDSDHSGCISRDELGQALTVMGYIFSDLFVDMVYKKYNFQAESDMQFDGFVQAILTIQVKTVKDMTEINHPFSA